MEKKRKKQISGAHDMENKWRVGRQLEKKETKLEIVANDLATKPRSVQ